MLLMIDNYDSFTYNLVQYFGELGEDVRVFRNDQITVEGIAELAPDRIVVSPSPGAKRPAWNHVPLVTSQLPVAGWETNLAEESFGRRKEAARQQSPE